MADADAIGLALDRQDRLPDAALDEHAAELERMLHEQYLSSAIMHLDCFMEASLRHSLIDIAEHEIDHEAASRQLIELYDNMYRYNMAYRASDDRLALLDAAEQYDVIDEEDRELLISLREERNSYQHEDAISRADTDADADLDAACNLYEAILEAYGDACNLTYDGPGKQVQPVTPTQGSPGQPAPA